MSENFDFTELDCTGLNSYLPLRANPLPIAKIIAKIIANFRL